MKDMFGRKIPDNYRRIIRRDVLAESLWEYGEDAIAEQMLDLTDEELHQVHRLAVWHHFNDPEPPDGPKLTNGRIASRAAIEFVEGRARDTSRRRRRTRQQGERYDAAYLRSLRSGDPPHATPAEELDYEGWERR